MIEVKREGVLLKKTTLGFERDGVLNPGVTQEGDVVHLFYRAVGSGNHSSIGYCSLKGPLMVKERNEAAMLYPQYDYEEQGMEDPRIVKIDELYYLTYTAFDGLNALGAIAVSKDLIHFDKIGLITPQISYNHFKYLSESNGKINEKYSRYNAHQDSVVGTGKKLLISDKNVILFPRKINGKFIFLHRFKPDIQIVSVSSISDLKPEFWKKYFLDFEESIALSPKYEHEISYIGGGCPPIETTIGWILIYHGVRDSIEGYVYSACVALLDLDDPRKEIARLPYPLFKPEQEWELKGEVNNVCFPTGTALFGDRLYVYYGAADEQIACASLSLSELLIELVSNKK